MACPISVKKSSFRGFEFDHESSSVSGGRRGATHEYPFREEHFDQDLGKMAPRFSVSGYVSTSDIRSKAQELETTLNIPGHGVLYDAWLNRERLVRVESFSIDVSRRDLQTVSFAATFVERGIEPAPTALRRAIGALNSFLTQFNEALATGYSLINGTRASVEQSIAGFQQAGSYFSFTHRRHFATSDNVVEKVSSLLGASPFNTPKEDIEDAVDAILAVQTEIQKAAFLSDLVAIEGESDGDKVQALLFAGVALSRYAEMAITRNYTNRTDAFAEVADFVRAANSFRVKASNFGLDELSKATLALVTLVGSRASNELGDIPQLASRDGAGLPALVLSYEIYDDIDEAKELMEQNNIISGASVQGEVFYDVANIA